NTGGVGQSLKKISLKLTECILHSKLYIANIRYLEYTMDTQADGAWFNRDSRVLPGKTLLARGSVPKILIVTGMPLGRNARVVYVDPTHSGRQCSALQKLRPANKVV